MSLVLISNYGSPIAFSSIPFDILPSTTPLDPPAVLPMLVPDIPRSPYPPRKSLSLFNFSSSKITFTCPEQQLWQVETSIPTCTFNPGALIPVSLSIRAPPPYPSSHSPAPVNLYIRASIRRKYYMRVEPRSLHHDSRITDIPEELLFESNCIEESDVVSRWGVIRNVNLGTRIKITDLVLPLNNTSTMEYSTSVDLIPSAVPATNPMIKALLPKPSQSLYSSHVHLSCQFQLVVDFAVGKDGPELNHLPPSGIFSDTSYKSTKNGKGCPFPKEAKMKTVSIPITIGSIGPTVQSDEEVIEEDESEENEFGTLYRDDALFIKPPPPDYAEAIKSPPLLHCVF